MLIERGVEVDHTTIYRWVQYYAPKILDKLKWYWKPNLSLSWRVDENYINIKDKYAYLYRALESLPFYRLALAYFYGIDYVIKVFIVFPISAGDFEIFIPAILRASNLSSAEPLPPEIMAPA